MIRLLNSPPAPSLGWPFRRHLRLSNVKVIFFFKNKSFIMILPLWLAAVGHHTTSHSCRAGQFAYCASAWSTVFLGDHIDGNDHTERIITVKHRVPHHTFVPQFSPPVSEITLTCLTFRFSRTSARPPPLQAMPKCLLRYFSWGFPYLEYWKIYIYVSVV